MNRAAKVALGCALFPVGLFVIGLVVFAGARAVGVPESRSRSESLEQAVQIGASEPTTEITSPTSLVATFSPFQRKVSPIRSTK